MIDAEAYKVFYFKNCIYFTSKFGLNARTCRTAQRIILWVGTLLGRENPVTKSVETFFLGRNHNQNVFIGQKFSRWKKIFDWTRSKRFYSVELGRNVFPQSKIFSLENFFGLTWSKNFFLGRTWSKCFSSVELGQNVFPRSKLVKLFFLGQI